MKTLFAINSLGAGGAEHSLVETLDALSHRLDPVVVCLVPRREGVQRRATESGIDVRFLGSGLGPGCVRELRHLIRAERPDLVHTTIFEADVAGRLAAAGTGVPVVTSLVNTSYAPVRRHDPGITPWKLTVARAVDGWTARHLTTHFHAITHAVKDAAVADLGIDPSRISVIERGRDPARLGAPSPARRAAARARLGLPSDVPVLVTVGRQEFQKGQWHLLEAMPNVLASQPDARLMVAGRAGNASGRLRAAVGAAGLDGQVSFLGHRDDVPEILAAADVFVFPSLYEGLGGAVIEAMALGLPIVASDLPAIREVVEADRNAVLVPPGSPSDLVEALDSLIPDEARRASMGARSRRIFEERFTLERSATRMLELFERVAADGRRPRR